MTEADQYATTEEEKACRYYDWFLHHDYMALAAQAIVTPFLATFRDFPPRQKAASFTIHPAMEKMTMVASSAGH